MTPEELLTQFDHYWTQKVKRGEVSSFTRLEWMAIELFVEWLKQQEMSK